MWQTKYALAVPKDLGLGLNFQPYLKIWDWDWIFSRAVKSISSLGICSLWHHDLTRFDLRNISYRKFRLISLLHSKWWHDILIGQEAADWPTKISRVGTTMLAHQACHQMIPTLFRNVYFNYMCTSDSPQPATFFGYSAWLFVCSFIKKDHKTNVHKGS